MVNIFVASRKRWKTTALESDRDRLWLLDVKMGDFDTDREETVMDDANSFQRFPMIARSRKAHRVDCLELDWDLVKIGGEMMKEDKTQLGSDCKAVLRRGFPRTVFSAPSAR